jgi:CBS-domain-containing membrane protein
MKTQKSVGFSAIEIILAIAIITVIGFVGYNVAKNTMFKEVAKPVNNNKTVTDIPAPQVINSTSDLVEAKASLDDINLDDDESDITTINSHLSEF